MQNIRCNDSRMQRRSESIETSKRKFAVDDRLVCKTSTSAAIFFGHRSAKQASFTCLGPNIAIVNVGLVPAVVIGHKFVGDEAPRLLLKQDKVFAHPSRARKI